MSKDKAEQIGNRLMWLAEHLSDEDCDITADEILEEITGRLISEEDAGQIKEYLSS